MSLAFHISGASSANIVDCSDAANIETALLQFDRAVEAGSDAALAGWARRWGRNLLNEALEPLCEGEA